MNDPRSPSLELQPNAGYFECVDDVDALLNLWLVGFFVN